VKDNLLYEVEQELSLGCAQLSACFRQVRDEIIIFSNDSHQSQVRLIEFSVAGSHFRLLTNRFDLSDLQVIILYA
jgi:hypothetical protein